MREYHRIKQQKSWCFNQNIRNKLQTFDLNNPSEYWKLWKSLRRQTTNSSSITLSNFGNYFTNQVQPPVIDYFDKAHMAEIENLITQYDSNDFTPNSPDLGHDICNGSITMDEITTHIDKLKVKKKAVGIDGIPSEFIKFARDKLTGPMHGVFNFLFSKGDWPDIWSEGLINAIHKKGSQNVEDNYRNVTVMPALGKVFESILNSRLTYRIIVLDLDDKFQFGFKNKLQDNR